MIAAVHADGARPDSGVVYVQPVPAALLTAAGVASGYKSQTDSSGKSAFNLLDSISVAAFVGIFIVAVIPSTVLVAYVLAKVLLYCAMFCCPVFKSVCLYVCMSVCMSVSMCRVVLY